MSDTTAVENSAQREDWLHRNAQAVNAETHQEAQSDSWQAALEGDHTTLSAPGQGVSRVTSDSGNDPYLTIIAEWNESLVGACECEAFEYNGGACKHLLFRVQKAAIGSHNWPESKGLFDTLVSREANTAGGQQAENLEQTTPDVTESTDAPQAAGDGGESTSREVPDPASMETVDVSTPTEEYHEADAFANPLPEVDEKYVMQMDGEAYIRKAGYARLLKQQGWRVSRDEIVGSHETDYQRSKYEARILDKDGNVLAEAVGSAGPPEKEDMANAEMNLDELAETRAWTRAASIATGEGMTALVEVDGGAL